MEIRRSAVYALLLAVGSACGGAAATRGGAVVERAELPFRVLSTDGGAEVSRERFVDALLASRAVCLGESHSNPHDHWAQWTILRWLLEKNRARRVETAVGFEMFQRPFQGVLDDYGRGAINESTMLSRTDWEHRWGFDYALYRPLVDAAVKNGAAVLALNLSTELRKKVSKHGVDGLDEDDKAKLPNFDLNDKEHRAWWDAIMASMGAHGHGHGHGHGKKVSPEESKARAERSYSVQVLWDETMADSAHRWLEGGQRRQAVIIAGSGHCHGSGIVRRMKRRGESRAVSVRPIVDAGKGRVADALAEPEVDYLFVMTPAR